MRRSKAASLLLLTFCFVFLMPPIARPQMESVELDESLSSLEDEIRFEPKGRIIRDIPGILEHIRRGQEFLIDKNAGGSQVLQRRLSLVGKKGKKKVKVITLKVTKPNFLLAVEDVNDHRMWPVLITDKGCVTNGFEVTKHRDNGVGSRFEVKYPENMAILALRTTVRAGPNRFEEVVYTPYSPEIDTYEVRQAGLNYLVRQIEQAYADLKARKIQLNGFARLSPDAVPTDIALALSIIEHIDPGRFQNCDKGKEINLVREVLAIVGANSVDAYAYSKSTAGARGLFQLVPDTYKRLVRRYPQAGLKKDFVEGCTDHVNAAKASLLLFDADLNSLSKDRLRAIRSDAREVGRYLAAAYNCGAHRVGKSAKKCRNEWTCQLPEETKLYLKKFDVVWDMGRELDR
jgi:hypothetical protein